MTTYLMLYFLQGLDKWICDGPGVFYTFQSEDSMTLYANAMMSNNQDAITSAFTSGQIFEEEIAYEEAVEAYNSMFSATSMFFDVDIVWECAVGETLVEDLLEAGTALLAALALPASERKAAAKVNESIEGRAAHLNAIRETLKSSPHVAKALSDTPDYQVTWFNECTGPGLDLTFTFRPFESSISAENCYFPPASRCVSYPTSVLRPGQATTLGFNISAVKFDTYQGWVTSSSDPQGPFAAFQLNIPRFGPPTWKYISGTHWFAVDWDALQPNTALSVTDQPAGCPFAIQYVATTTTPAFSSDTLSLNINFQPPAK